MPLYLYLGTSIDGAISGNDTIGMLVILSPTLDYIYHILGPVRISTRSVELEELQSN